MRGAGSCGRAVYPRGLPAAPSTSEEDIKNRVFSVSVGYLLPFIR